MFSDGEIGRVAKVNIQLAALMRAAQAAGSIRRLAKQMKRKLDGGNSISHQAVLAWFKAGRCPAERVLEVERVTGVSKHLLRPDLYPEQRRAAAVPRSAI